MNRRWTLGVLLKCYHSGDEVGQTGGLIGILQVDIEQNGVVGYNA